jgi:hypothetical protein
MRHSPIDPTLFTKNRMRLLERLPANTLSVVNANDLMPSNADGTLPYHPNSDLFYLSGIEQEESILVLQPGAKKIHEQVHLFIRKPNPTLLLWEGYKLNKTDARKISGISQVHWLEDFNQYSPNLPARLGGPFISMTTSIKEPITRWKPVIKGLETPCAIATPKEGFFVSLPTCMPCGLLKNPKKSN